MNILHAIILGIVEGITEFLPISSTGHLIVASHVLNLPSSDFLKTFEVVIQFGAILAVVWYYRKTIFPLNKILWQKVATAFVPTAVVGFVLYKIIKKYLIGNLSVVLFSLIVGGIVIILFEKYFSRRTPQAPLIKGVGDSDISYKQAFWIGVIQSLAVIPGVSRSAATITGGQALGVNRKDIVQFSFLLAIPTMFAAAGYDLLKSGISLGDGNLLLILVGMAVSFVVALLSIKFLLRYVQNHNFIYFGIYRIIIGILFWLILF